MNKLITPNGTLDTEALIQSHDMLVAYATTARFAFAAGIRLGRNVMDLVEIRLNINGNVGFFTNTADFRDYIDTRIHNLRTQLLEAGVDMDQYDQKLLENFQQEFKVNQTAPGTAAGQQQSAPGGMTH